MYVYDVSRVRGEKSPGELSYGGNCPGKGMSRGNILNLASVFANACPQNHAKARKHNHVYFLPAFPRTLNRTHVGSVQIPYGNTGLIYAPCGHAGSITGYSTLCPKEQFLDGRKSRDSSTVMFNLNHCSEYIGWSTLGPYS